MTNAASGPIAIVTGGAGGIGLAVCRRLHARGYRVAVVERELSLAARACEAIGETAIPFACDVTDPEQFQSLCDAIDGEWAGEIDLLHCNAGVIFPGDVAATSASDMDLQLDVMLRSSIQLIRTVLPHMLSNDRGHIVATVSIGGILPLPGSATYSAAKAGLRAFICATAAELRDTNVHIGGVYPSAVDTPMLLAEARSGGSPLNFVGAVQSVDAVADGVERVIDKQKLEVYVPYSDGLSTRLACAFPGILRWLYPLLDRMGQKGKQQFLAEADQRDNGF